MSTEQNKARSHRVFEEVWGKGSAALQQIGDPCTKQITGVEHVC